MCYIIQMRSRGRSHISEQADNHKAEGFIPSNKWGSDVAISSDAIARNLLEIEEKTVRLRLKGACGGCPHATMTIKNGLERILREELDPEIVIERVL